MRFPDLMEGLQMRKSILKIASLLAGATLALSACNSATNEAEQDTSKKSFQIGIAQYVSHPSLDASVAGFKKALEDANLDVSYDEQNAQGDQGTASSIAAKMAATKPDLVLAVATPTAQALAQAIVDIPLLFTSVTDPVAAELVDSAEKPGANVTGTSDMNPVAEQIGLVKRVKPDAKKVGVIYSSGEVNSEVQVKIAREAAKNEGLELSEKTITNSSEVIQAVKTLGDVDAIYVPTDNMVVSALDSLLATAEENGILVVVGEADSVEKGGAITYGLDYEQLGYQTGEMAVKILTEGADPATTPVETQDQPQLVINPAAAKRMGVEIPQELLDQADKIIE